MSKDFFQGAVGKIDTFIEGGKKEEADDPVVRSIVLELNMEGLDTKGSSVKSGRVRITFSRALDSLEKETAKDILESAGASDIKIKGNVVDFDFGE